MKKFLAAVIFMLSLSNIACAATEFADNPPPKSFAASVNDFGWKYFATIDRDENIFYSPYGLNAALSILANGADGETRREILSALGVDDIDTLNDGHKKFLEYVEKNYRDDIFFVDYNFLLINKKIVKRGINVDFRRVVTDVYKSDVQELDFNFSNAERKKIARWVSEKTAGAISDHYSIANTDMVTDLHNIDYLRGLWQFPFDAKQSAVFDFMNRDGTKSELNMMSQTFDGKISYCADDNFKGIKLPYKARAALYLILPADDDALDIVERWQNQPTTYRENFLDALKTAPAFDGKVVVRMPEFFLERGDVADANFNALGIKKAFSDAAEFPGIVKGTPLKINLTNYHVKINFDEQGTGMFDAAPIETPSAPDKSASKVVKFLAERPFVFVIRDSDTNITLFVGTFNGIY